MQEGGCPDSREENIMNREEAAGILGVRKGETAQEIRRRYHMLLHRYHPDAAGADDPRSLEYSRKVIEAFRFLKKEGLQHAVRSGSGWGVKENPAAYCARNIYMEDDLFGDSITLDIGEWGKYYWDPDVETFRMFLRSVGESANEQMEEIADQFRPGDREPDEETVMSIRAKLLHLLIQEFIDPYDCLDQMYPYIRRGGGPGQLYHVKCHAAADRSLPDAAAGDQGDKEWKVYAQDLQLLAVSPEGEKVRILFEETSLNYVILPLFLFGSAHGRLKFLPGSVPGSARGRNNPCRNALLLLSPDISKRTDPTARINQEIDETLKKYRAAFIAQ